MSKTEPPVEEQPDSPTRRLYHHVTCEHLKGLKIQLTATSPTLKKHLAIVGMSSTETIRATLPAVDASPFKSVFVVREATGEVLVPRSRRTRSTSRPPRRRTRSPHRHRHLRPPAHAARTATAAGATPAISMPTAAASATAPARAEAPAAVLTTNWRHSPSSLGYGTARVPDCTDADAPAGGRHDCGRRRPATRTWSGNRGGLRSPHRAAAATGRSCWP